MADFSTVFGNTATKSRLCRLISDKSLPHALMLLGDKGSGRHTLATAVAMALNCENRGRSGYSLPCGTCSRCKRIREGNFTDVKVLRKSSGKATIGVEEVRIFKEDMYLSPTESELKIYIFEEAELLTPQAQNALLVALEEPPKNVVNILLCSSSEKMLDTIKSRVQNIPLEKFSPEALSEYLVASSDAARAMKLHSPARFSALLMGADGRIGVALDMLTEDKAKENEESFLGTVKLLSSLTSSVRYAELYAAITSLPRQRQELKSIFEGLLTAIGDLVAVKHNHDAPLIFFAEREQAEDLSTKFSTKRLLSLYDTLLWAIGDLDKNANVTALLTSFAVKIKNT